VLLEPGATAHAILQIVDAYNYPSSICEQGNSSALRVYEPGDYSALLVPFSVAVCRKAGPVYLGVSTTIPGTGIPGYST
jgi:hypothetical protein